MTPSKISSTPPGGDLRLWFWKVGFLSLLAVACYLLYSLFSLVVIFLLSVFLTVILHGAIEWGTRHHISTIFSLLGVYLIAFLLMLFVVSTIVPIFLDYMSHGINALMLWIDDLERALSNRDITMLHLPHFLQSTVLFLLDRFDIAQMLVFLQSNIGTIQSFVTNQVRYITSGGLSLLGVAGSMVTQISLLAIMTFLMSLERRELLSFSLRLAPVGHRPYITESLQKIYGIVHAWIRGQIFLALSIFLIALVGLFCIEWIFGASTGKVASLAMIAGLMEFIPYIGPLIALIPALVVGLGTSWEMGVTILIFYIIMQQVENNILVPYIMSKSLDFSPLYVFIVMIAGGILGGILGIILAVPAAAVIRYFVLEWMARR